MRRADSEHGYAGATLLVVDDDHAAAEALSHLLRLERLHVLTAVDAITGLQLAARVIPTQSSSTFACRW